MPTPIPYPDQPPYRTHALDADGGHRLHVREWGCADGIPALLLHGGPGTGSSPVLWRMFDPALYRVIAPDQRGSGLSTPRGQVAHNTTTHLLADLRALRTHLGIARWLVVGGSWGATLALAHALDAPEAVDGLLLRAIFLSRAEDIARFFDRPPPGRETSWRHFAASVAPTEGQSLLDALHTGLHGDDSTLREAMALAWWRWERALAGWPDDQARLDGPALAAQVDRLRVQSHYLRQACWLDRPSLVDRCGTLNPDLPVHLVQGRQDAICPPEGAALLQSRMPQSRLEWVDDAGHDPTHPGMVAAMVGALDRWAEHRVFQ